MTEMRWDEKISRWIIRTNRDDAMKARFVVMANGPLHRPKLPGIPGVETFKGHSFHTSRWDYHYTGGDCMGGLTGLKDKRVGIIGTGATAVQCVPHVGAGAKELYVFQRTPSSVDVRNDRRRIPIGSGLSSLAGSSSAWTISMPWSPACRRTWISSVTAGPTSSANSLTLMRKQNEAGADTNLADTLQLADFEKMEQIRARVDAVVRDREKAEALKPYYNQFCKRPCFHDQYLDTFNRPNVHLIDTDGKGVERITERGVVANGKEYEIDCLIYATGFEVGTDYTRRSGYQLYGRGGMSLSEKWKNGVATLHGMHSRGFPNVFIMSNSQSGFTANYPHMLNEQSKHLSYIIRECGARQVRVVEASQQAEDEWIQTIIDSAMLRQKFQEECTPGYYNNEGKPSDLAARNGFYGHGPIAFVNLLEAWRSDGTLKGLELNKA